MFADAYLQQCVYVRASEERVVGHRGADDAKEEKKGEEKFGKELRETERLFSVSFSSE